MFRSQSRSRACPRLSRFSPIAIPSGRSGSVLARTAPPTRGVKFTRFLNSSLPERAFRYRSLETERLFIHEPPAPQPGLRLVVDAGHESAGIRIGPIRMLSL